MAFQILNNECLRRIRPLLTSAFPKSAMMLNIFDMTLSEKFPTESLKLRIYGYNGVPDLESLFLVVVITSKNLKDEYSIIYAPEKITGVMLKALESLHDWTKCVEFGATPLHVVQLLEKLVEEKGGELRKGPADDMYLPIDAALRLNIDREELQKEFEVDKLSPEHSGKVNAHWKYGGEGGNISIAEEIRGFGAAGVFKKLNDNGSKLEDDNELCGRTSDDLVSWVILTRVGTLNALYTLDEYRRKGLGKWTMEAASKWMAEEGWTPLVEIEPYNKQSRKLMETIGFKLIHTVCWMKYKPPNLL